MTSNIKCVIMNISINEYSFYHCVFPKKDASFVLQFAGMFIHLTVHVEKKYLISAYS